MTVTRVLLALALLATAAGCSGQPPAPSTTVPTPSTAAPSASTTTPPTSTVTATSAPVASPSSTGNLDGFLAALRAGGVPVSATGESEALIGQGVCEQIRAGNSPDKLAHDLTSAGYTSAQAATVVAAAQENFCG